MKELEKLKQLVLHSKDLQEPLSYLFDLVDNNTLFNCKEHQAIENIPDRVELLAILGVLKDQIFERFGITISGLMPLFYEISEYHFIHGACSTKELFTPITLMYFSDIKIGVAAVSNKEINFFRFSLMLPSEVKNLH